MTGLIYVVIIALWAAVLIPIWLRRHDQVSQTRSTQKFSTAMKSLAESSSGLDTEVDPRMRGRTAHPAQHDQHVAMARYGQRDIEGHQQRRRTAAMPRENSARVATDRSEVRVQTRSARGAEVREGRGIDSDRRRDDRVDVQRMIRDSKRIATRRRWTWVLLLAAATAGTAAAWFLGYAPRMAIAVPGALLALFVIAALASAPARASRRREFLSESTHAGARGLDHGRSSRGERVDARRGGDEAWDPRDANIPASVVGSSTERLRRDARRVAQPAARTGQHAGIAPDLLESAQAVRSQRRSPSRVTFEVDDRDEDTASVPAIRGYVDGLRRAANDS